MSPNEFNSILKSNFSNQIYDVSESDYREFEGRIIT